LSNELLAEYIAGLYDSDGSVYLRNGEGSNCVELTTCSETMARQIQLVLLRYGIHATLRTKTPNRGEIKGNYNSWIVEIRNLEDIKRFAEFIPLKHPEKKAKLYELSRLEKVSHTNLDLLPNVGERLRRLLVENGISLRKIKWHDN